MSKKFTFSKWVLSGPPETWRGQLDAYYAAEPVFALLGGISEGDWEPVHRFCEENKIPNLFPVVDYPVISNTDWYTLYFSRGIRQEAEAAARYLNTLMDLLKNDRNIVQVYRDDRRGHTLAEGFRQAWEGAGHPAAAEFIIKEGETLSDERLRQIVKEKSPEVLIVWDGPSAIPAMEKLSEAKDRPKFIYASATWLGNDLYAIADPLRGQLFMTYPYRMPQEEGRFNTSLNKILMGKPLSSYDAEALKKSYITNDMLGKALMEMRSEYYRDFLFDTIGMMKDTYLPLFDRITFGPGQRYASKGCFIVQLGEGDAPRLERRSEWLIQ